MGPANSITIFSVCDDHFVVLLAALIKSIEVNHKTNEKIHFYIIDDRIREDNRQKLIDSINPEVIQVNWLKIEDLITRDTKLPRDHTSFPMNIYARLFIPHIIQEDIEKILYLDADMIVLRDISELWYYELNNKIVGGVVDRPKVVSSSWGAIANYKELGLSPETKYFNSGLLLIDPVKWRTNNITNRIIQAVSDNLKYANYPDQYGLNVVFANQWQEIDQRWNCHSSSTTEHPALIHFSGRKPIYKSYRNNMNYKAEFEKYSDMTEWRGYRKIGEMERLIKKAYNIVEKYSSLF